MIAAAATPRMRDARVERREDPRLLGWRRRHVEDVRPAGKADIYRACPGGVVA